MKYLLDTNVVSALRVRGRNPAVETWAASIPIVDLFITAITISEIERGVVAKERVDTAQGIILRRWFEDHVLPAFTGRVLPFDLASARITQPTDSTQRRRRPAAGRAEPHCRKRAAGRVRSEEHTSELQSRGHLVCRLLLEK